MMTPPPTYQPQMDGLRAVAILLILVHHFHGPLHEFYEFGPLGVRFFFVLSAFLVTRGFLKAKSRCTSGKTTVAGEFVEFEKRRLIRILPPYYLFLAVGAVLAIVPIRTTLGWTLPFLTNFYMAHIGDFPPAISHFWYLAVQEQIYLIWPWLILLVPISRLRPLFVGLIVLTLAFRFGCIATNASEFVRWFNPIGSLDSFAIGGILACLSIANPSLLERSSIRLWTGFLALGALWTGHLLRGLPLENPWSVGSETLEALGTAWIVACSVGGFRGWPGQFLASAPLVYLGKISYGIYVYHVLISILFDSFSASHGLVLSLNLRFAILTVLTVLAAAISWHFMETPLTKIRARSV